VSLRSTAKAVGVSPQYYSEIERGHRSALTAERLNKLRDFFDLSTEETDTLFNKAAEARKISEFDFSDYIRQRDYVMKAFACSKRDQCR
jgi:transcriptional regulator with XRE-family HTH domain